MTKLTNEMRNKIRYSVEAALPSPTADAMRKRAITVALALLPPTVRAVYDNVETRPFVNVTSFWLDCMTLAVPATTDSDDRSAVHKALGSDAELTALHNAYDAARDLRSAAIQELRNGLIGCSTIKQFVERFPDLAQYAPADIENPSNLPATTAVMDALKAAGLPQPEAA